jgi:hypothetical protein
MKNLRALYLPNTQITDAGLDNLSTLTELWDLSIGNTRITDAGLARLPEMHQIYSLNLTGTWITDASVEILKRYPTLQMLTLTETSVTEQGIAELKKFLPHVYFPEFKIIKKENPAPTQPAQPQPQPQTGENEGNKPAETTATTSASVTPPAFALYRLRSPLITAKEALQKPLDELELAETPFLTDADIVTYYGPSHKIRLTAEAFARIPGTFTSRERAATYGTPFVITVQSKRIYCGAFCTMISSQSGPDCPIIGDGFLYLHREPRNTIGIEYNPKLQVPDPRGDERIRNALERIGKYQTWYNPPASTSLRVHKVAWNIESDQPSAKQLPWRFPDRSRSTSATALHILTPTLLTVADLTSVTVVKTSPAGPSTVQVQFDKDARESVLLELQHDRPRRAVVRDGQIYYEGVPESVGPSMPNDKYAHMLAVVPDGQILNAPIDPEALRSDWIPLVSLQSEDEAKVLAESIAASLRAFQTPPQPETGESEKNGTSETTVPPASAPPAPGKTTPEGKETDNTSLSLKTAAPGGPLDIRFAGLQVGLGDFLYNQKGEKIGEWLNWPYCYPDRKNLNWRFILDLPETPGPLFTQFNVYRKGETGAETGYGFSPRRGYLGGGVASPVESDGKTRRVILNMAFQDGTDDPEERPDAVDLVFSYYYGPPNEARYRFSGPFEMGKTTEDRGGSLSLRQYLRHVGSASSYFVLQSKTPIDMNFACRSAFDKRGERRRCNLMSGYGTSLNENSIAISVSGIPLEEVAAITVDEKPYEFRMNGIPISPPLGAREETEAQMAEIARALDIEEVDFQKLETYHFGSDPQKALRCLPYLRGVPLRSAWWAIMDSKTPVKLENLSPELAEQLHQTALKWAQAPVPHHLLGIEMGLEFGWPEFDAMALDLFMRQKTLTYMASGNQESRQRN